MRRYIGISLTLLVLAGCGAEGPINNGPDIQPQEQQTVVVQEPAPPVTVTVSAPVPTTFPPAGAPSPVVTPPPAGVIPNVVGLDHQLAQDTLQAAGFYNLSEEDATGQNRVLLIDRNWVVVEQEPAGGSAAPSNAAVVLRSKKIGE